MRAREEQSRFARLAEQEAERRKQTEEEVARLQAMLARTTDTRHASEDVVMKEFQASMSKRMPVCPCVCVRACVCVPLVQEPNLNDALASVTTE
jgi:hypothetical protein